MSRELNHAHDKPSTLAWAVLVAAALSSLNTKIAGLAWLLWLIWAFGVWRQRGPSHVHPIVQQAAQVWLGGLLAYAGIQLFMAWGWHGPCCTYTSEVNSYLRLSLSALATLVLVRHLRPWPDMRHHITLALVAALALGCGLAALVGRDLPSHPIPWAGAMGFLLCVLIPHVWDEDTTTPRRWLYGLGVFLGMTAVVLSQSRGAFVVLAWPLVMALVYALKRHRRSLIRVGWVTALALAGLTVLSASPTDPLRLRQAITETQLALQAQDFNSSLGARVYLTQLAWQQFESAPWVGVGAQERLHLLKTAGLDQSTSEAEALNHVRSLGHVHNQYLHHAMDHGLPGLVGFMFLLCCMFWTCARVSGVSDVAGIQMGFITLTFIFLSFSNVNLAHNYFALALGLSIGLVLIQALSKPVLSRQAPNTR
jgi:O-antigen ligase